MEHYAGRLISIHPSLLPAFTGLHTHQRAIDAGCKFAGVTVHQVTAELDVGPILGKAVVPVLPGGERKPWRWRADPGTSFTPVQCETWWALCFLL